MKKIKFSELLKQDNVVIHTPKEKQAVKLLKKLDRLGYEWLSFEKLTSSNNKCQIYGQNTCYATSIQLNGKTYFLSFYGKNEYTIVEFDDIDLEN